MNEIQCKVTFVGETEVGKSSLIRQFIVKEFSQGYITTIGSDQSASSLIIEGQKINLNIWDTAGQERFRTVNKIFLKNSKIVILVYDITKKATFEKIVDFWYPKVCEVLGQDIIIGLAGNKSDLYEKEDISVEEVKQFAEKNNMIFKETTATNYDSIDNLLNELVQVFYKKNKDTIIDKADKAVVTLSEKKVNEEKKRSCCQNNKNS